MNKQTKKELERFNQPSKQKITPNCLTCNIAMQEVKPNTFLCDCGEVARTQDQNVLRITLGNTFRFNTKSISVTDTGSRSSLILCDAG